MAKRKKRQFKAEIKQLLQILIHSLYQDREIFLRELISNASDALTRVQFEMLTNTDVVDADAELGIWLEVVEEDDQKKLIIKDNGIGMNAEELAQNLGTIAQSGAREFLAQIEEGNTPPSDIIGQFGVGFYSAFMVGSEVKVLSRSFRPEDEAASWTSDGGESYRVDSAEKSDRGTEIHITLKSDMDEFTQTWKLREIIKKHSDYVSYPIYVDGDQANSQESLWRKSPSDVEDEAYQQFYQQMTFDFTPPLSTIHFTSDMPVSLRALLFIPSKRERSPISQRKEPGVKLYSNNVLIQEYCTDLLPEWLNFVDGVVDSEDLPLNVSRETVHNNRLMRQLAKVVRKRVLREIRKISEKDADKFAEFWKEYGRVLKEGMAVDPSAKDDVEPLLHYVSSKSDGKLTSLKEYVARMPEDQENIYYVLGDDVSSVAYSPHLDPFKAKEWEVLYFVEPIDAFMVTSWQEFNEKKLVNVDDAEIELPEEDEEDSAESTTSEKAINLFIGRAVKQLGERVSEVKLSKVLKDSPVRLVASENGQSQSGFDRIQRLMNQDYEVPVRVMEVNKNHPIIVNLSEQLEASDGKENDSSELIDMTIEQLYESALIQEGLHPNPASMIPRIQKLMEFATKK